jgi:hypothetical protein
MVEIADEIREIEHRGEPFQQPSSRNISALAFFRIEPK